MATRRKTAPVEETEPVTAEEYVEDESWDGTPDTEESAAEEETPKRRGRQVSPLIVATREYEAAHRRAEKCRRALAKVKPLADAAEVAEKEEKEAFEALGAELAKLHS